jgi:sugar/nucleoside kinase (ribokinase family)
VALTLGAAGCVLAVPGHAPVRVAAHPARARDTTGAGDAFCGAFMSRWLAEGWPPDDPTPPIPGPQIPTPPIPGPQVPTPPIPGPQVPTPPIADPQIAALISATEFATRVAASVVTRFGARPIASH